MTFKELQASMMAAMKERNRVKKDVIADMVACAKNMAIEKGCKDNITDEIVKEAILKSKKRCQEQIDTCPANRPDLLEAYTICMGYINEFAPKMMDEEEIKVFLIKEIINMNLDGSQPWNKGVIMKNIMPKLKGKADGKLINKTVEDFIKKQG